MVVDEEESAIEREVGVQNHGGLGTRPTDVVNA